MNAIIDNLKNKEILYEDSIELLKNYIASRFPDESESYRARVFADAVHKILDEHVVEFQRQQQKDIKRSILTEAVTTNSFEINAYDILCTCVELDIDETVYADDLVSWLNHQQDIPVQSDMIHEISESVRAQVREATEAFYNQINDESVVHPLIDAYDSVPEQSIEIEEAFGYFADDEPVQDESSVYTETVKNRDAYPDDRPVDPYHRETYFGANNDVELDASYEQQGAEDVIKDMDTFESDLMAQLEAAFAEVDGDETVETSVTIEDTPESNFGDSAEEDSAQDRLQKEEVIARHTFDDTESGKQEVLLPSEPTFGDLEDVFAATLNATSKKDEPLNMYNMADIIYESDVMTLQDEDRPVIKVERERRIDAIQELPELPEEPLVRDTFRELLTRWVQSGQYRRDILKIAPFAAGFIVLVVVLYFLLTGAFSTEDIVPEPDELESTTGLVLEVVPELQKAPEPERAVEVLMRREKRMDGSSLHESIQHKAIDEDALKAYLSRQNSLLAEDIYFDIVIAVAEEYDLNPLLLFAITGQEQHFVPKDHEEAVAIINNPFNVYGSWQKFNTTLKESAQIASKTIHTLSAHRPDDMDPIQWINNNEILERRYAEHDEWHLGVSIILDNLEAVAGRP